MSAHVLPIAAAAWLAIGTAAGAFLAVVWSEIRATEASARAADARTATIADVGTSATKAAAVLAAAAVVIGPGTAANAGPAVGATAAAMALLAAAGAMIAGRR